MEVNKSEIKERLAIVGLKNSNFPEAGKLQVGSTSPNFHLTLK